MPVKLLMTWDIRPGREQDYFEFMVRNFIPNIQRMGLEPSDAWFTMYGDPPQIMVGAVSSGKDNLERALESSEWDGLIQELHQFVDNFRTKIVPARQGFQL